MTFRTTICLIVAAVLFVAYFDGDPRDLDNRTVAERNLRAPN